MDQFETEGLSITALFAILLFGSFYYAWTGYDLNVTLWLSGVGLVGTVFSLVYFFVPNTTKEPE